MTYQMNKHIRKKIHKIASLYFVLIYALRFCAMKKINTNRIKVLDYIIANELDELSDYFKYRK